MLAKNARHAEQRRAETEKLALQAKELVAEFPHCAPLRSAMWAVASIGLEKCRELAPKNLSNWTFRKAVVKVGGK